LRQHTSKNCLNFVEFCRADGERGSQLNHGVPSIIRAAVQPSVKQCFGEESPEKPLGFFAIEGFFCRFVLHELNSKEVAGATNVPDDGNVEKAFQHSPELGRVPPDVIENALSSKILMFSRATAADTGCPPNV